MFEEEAGQVVERIEDALNCNGQNNTEQPDGLPSI